MQFKVKRLLPHKRAPATFVAAMSSARQQAQKHVSNARQKHGKQAWKKHGHKAQGKSTGQKHGKARVKTTG
jgi:hypothetical protein